MALSLAGHDPNAYHQKSREHGVTADQFVLLATLARGDAFTQRDLAARMADAIARQGGLLTRDDLAHYTVRRSEPLRGHYRGYEITTNRPPGKAAAGGMRHGEAYQEVRATA